MEPSRTQYQTKEVSAAANVGFDQAKKVEK
jgi:hypothetical protein